ncbi:GDP-L-galactose phosphorylase 1 [Capsicum chacoense]|uniref:GDP-L-galactose phosphorylase 1 n=1 Tax=Capsicum annuum TaxID=4072 RepID=A0A1U8HAC0_CAPAN|nr:GDP-L-galactose phosphorylase 1 [Capsicum annuum]KAF3641450.1 GDP-L-galactose phosphorylase 1 [Capsicum annuum]PHT79927.1 GDP-L-galactose phosphorylase 1 [Capsicum annuum]
MMLKIKRVPTLVSNFQKDEDEIGARGVGCGRNCLRNCCLPGSKLPLYAFKNLSYGKFVADETMEPPVDFLESLLLGEWEDRQQKGLFRYDVTACETKVIPGEYGFIAQLNEGRHLKKRPTEFRVDKVLQPFDGSKFNFTKVGQEELLFQFEASDEDEVQLYPDAPIDAEKSPSVVAINVSPIEYGHVLLIPKVLECLPQRIDRDSFLLALHMAVEAANPYFRLGYNSLGAFATINHLHFQAYYLAVQFPIEKAPTQKISVTGARVKISEMLNYPVRGLVFEGGNTLEDLANVVSDCCICLQENNIPYNVLISDSGKRIFLLPQCYAEKQALGEVSPELLDTQVNPAVWEISGHMVLKRKEDYEGATEANAWRLLAEVSLSEVRFQEVTALIFEAIGLSVEENEHAPEGSPEDLDVTPPQPMEEIDGLSTHTTMVPV